MIAVTEIERERRRAEYKQKMKEQREQQEKERLEREEQERLKRVSIAHRGCAIGCFNIEGIF